MTEDVDGGLQDSGERYERGERIATGGMGEVWRARDTVLGREVAVKILKSEYADDATFRARFEAEARHAAGLHHPGIASVFDYGVLREANTPYLVMELVDGKPLSDLLANGQPIDPEVARGLALQVAEALAAAHAAGVVHRDVKPANLLVTPDGRIKITDFGIARATGSVAFTQTGQIVGTPQYLSPEQARGDSATAASDVYALGVVLFECLTGRRPFSADSPIATALAQIQQDVPPLPETIPPALAAVVTRALAKKPAERYADGAEIAAALRAAAEGEVPVAAPVPAAEHTQVLTSASAPVAAAALVEADDEPPPPARAGSRWPLYAVALLALVLVAALLITHPWTGQGASSSDGDPSAAAQGDTVRVRKAAYLGDPIEDAVSDLRGKGLKTKVETQDNPGDEDAGTVADLSPTGNVEKGATITLQAWGDPPAEKKADKGKKGDKGDSSGPGNSEENPPEENPDPGNPDPGNPDPGLPDPGDPVPSDPVQPGSDTQEPGQVNQSAPAQGRAEPDEKGN